MADDGVKVKKERDPIFMVCLVVFLLASVAVVGATVYNNYIKTDDTVAVAGDTVTVNYTGTYYDFYGNEHYVVFDTSMWSVANDDNVPKAGDFKLNSESTYSPLKYKIGGTDVLTMFGNAAIGHKVGDRFQVMVPAGEGYNAPDTQVTVDASQSATMQATEKLTLDQFKSIYGYELKSATEIEKSAYGWPAHASYNSSDNTVTLVYYPTAGQTYNVVDNEYGKVDLVVSAVSGSTITYTYSVHDYVVVENVDNEKEIQMIKVDLGSKVFYITSVMDLNNDNVADSFTYKTVGERYNEDLYFEIELVSINP